MKAEVQNAVRAVVAQKVTMQDLSVLSANGCTTGVLTGCPAILAKLAKGEMLSTAEVAEISAKGGDPVKFLGIKAQNIPAPTVTIPANETAAVPMATEHVAPNVTATQFVTVEGDAFGFILKTASNDKTQEKALRSLYNSMVSRQQTKVVEGYRKALSDVGVKIESKDVTDAMKVTRTEIGLDKMLDGVLSKKGFRTSRDEQNSNLIAAFRDNLAILGIAVSNEQHSAALAFGKSYGDAFAASAAAGLKKRGLAFAS